MTRFESMLYGVVAAAIAVSVIAFAAFTLRSAYDEGYDTGWRCAQAHGEYYECKRRTE